MQWFVLVKFGSIIIWFSPRCFSSQKSKSKRKLLHCIHTPNLHYIIKIQKRKKNTKEVKKTEKWKQKKETGLYWQRTLILNPTLWNGRAGKIKYAFIAVKLSYLSIFSITKTLWLLWKSSSQIKFYFIWIITIFDNLNLNSNWAVQFSKLQKHDKIQVLYCRIFKNVQISNDETLFDSNFSKKSLNSPKTNTIVYVLS